MNLSMIKGQVSFSDFQKLDLRVGKVISVDKIAGSQKLLRLEADLGKEFGIRIILAGIAQWYQTKDLKNKKFIFLVNLEAKKMMGMESNGMILCADDQGRAIIIPVHKDIPEGSVVR